MLLYNWNKFCQWLECHAVIAFSGDKTRMLTTFTHKQFLKALLTWDVLQLSFIALVPKHINYWRTWWNSIIDNSPSDPQYLVECPKFELNACKWTSPIIETQGYLSSYTWQCWHMLQLMYWIPVSDLSQADTYHDFMPNMHHYHIVRLIFRLNDLLCTRWDNTRYKRN